MALVSELLFENDDTPGSAADFHFLDDFLRGEIDHGNVIRGAVGGVERFAVRRESNAPGTFAHFKRAADRVGCGIDDEDLVSAAGTYVKFGRVGGEQNRHRLDDSTLAESDGLNRFVFGTVDYGHGAVVFGVDVGSRTIG